MADAPCNTYGLGKNSLRVSGEVRQTILRSSHSPNFLQLVRAQIVRGSLTQNREHYLKSKDLKFSIGILIENWSKWANGAGRKFAEYNQRVLFSYAKI